MDPQLGVFLSVDPVTAYDQPVGHFNRYRYANGNPYKFTDPEGRQSLPRSVYEIDWTKPETRQALREAVSMVADFRAVAVSSTATEADAMTTRKIPPFPVDEPTNDDDNPAFDLSTFQGCLKRIRDGEGSDGMLWPEENLSDGRRQSLARIDRAAVGIADRSGDAACGQSLRIHGHARPPSG